MKPAPFLPARAAVYLLVLSCHLLAPAQQPAARRGVIGEVAAIDATARRLELVADSGDTYSVTLTPDAKVQKVPPGATGLESATAIPLEQVAAGDRVYVRGAVDAERATVEASSLIVMSRQEITARQREQREQWRRRGVSGVVTAVDPATGNINIEARTRGRAEPVEVKASGANVKFKRYAPGSARYDKALASNILEIKRGDHLRALGERQGNTFVAEEIVSGAFRTFAATVETVDAAGRQLVVKEAGSGQKIKLGLSGETSLRQVPPQMVDFMAARAQAGGPGGGQGPPRANGQAHGTPPAGAPEGTGPQGGSRGDLREMMARMPAVQLEELKPGQAVAVLAAMPEPNASGVAIALLTGIEALMRPAENMPSRGPSMMDPGLSGLLEQSLEMPQ